MKKRHLRDLYVRGTLHTMNDNTPNEEAVTVFLKKLNLAENEKAIRKANAARAVEMAAAEDPQSEIYLAVLGDAMDTPRENLVEHLISEPLSKKREAIELEIGAKDEWSKENYLQGLNDAWLDGMRERFHTDPDDKEARATFEAMKRFSDEVDVLVEGEAKALRRDYEHTPEEELREKAIKSLLKQRADIIWVDTYRKAELLMATRDEDNHRELYFEEVTDLDELETPTLLNLLKAYREMLVEPQEGKDSEETPSS